MKGITRITVDTWHGRLRKPCMVPTPDPYFVEGADTNEAWWEGLMEKVALLWKILALLEVPPMEARKQRYSLNDYTRSALARIALDREEYETLKIIRESL